jgi:hypothetical protein
MSLIDTVRQESVTDFHREKIGALDAFDFNPVRKKVAHDLQATAPYVEQGIENLKRYYVVALLDPLNQHAVSSFVDPFWHTHALFTRDYRDFCLSIYGYFIHHEPLDPDDAAQVEHVRRLYDYTLDVYHRIFLDVDVAWWPPRADTTRFELVCKHQLILSEEVQAHALLPTREDLIDPAGPPTNNG